MFVQKNISCWTYAAYTIFFLGGWRFFMGSFFSWLELDCHTIMVGLKWDGKILWLRWVMVVVPVLIPSLQQQPPKWSQIRVFFLQNHGFWGCCHCCLKTLLCMGGYQVHSWHMKMEQTFLWVTGTPKWHYTRKKMLISGGRRSSDWYFGRMEGTNCYKQQKGTYPECLRNFCWRATGPRQAGRRHNRFIPFLYWPHAAAVGGQHMQFSKTVTICKSLLVRWLSDVAGKSQCPHGSLRSNLARPSW